MSGPLMAAANVGWYVLDATSGAPGGPYSEQAVADLVRNGNVSAETMVWAEGQPSWQQLDTVPELKTYIDANATEDRRNNNKPKASKHLPEEVLAAFQAEISAIEAEQEPPEDEREFEDDDGTVYIWDTELKKFVPKEPTDRGSKPATDYGVEDMVYVPEDEVIPSLAEARAAQAAEVAAVEGDDDGADDLAKKKQKHWKRDKSNKDGRKEANASASTSGQDGSNKPEAGQGPPYKKKKGEPQPSNEPATWFELKHNTSVYVTGLPEDTTVEEVVRVFTKCGIIKEDDQGKPRVKLYRDKASGQLKGDGLVTYLKEPSVLLAEQILDGAPFRDDMSQTMTVSKAQFEMKGEKYMPKAKPGKKKDKNKGLKQDKLLGWFGADERAKPELVTVVLRNMFHPDEFVGNPEGVQELEQDVKAECAKLGAVDKVRVFKTNPEGVITVRFVMEEGAKVCLEKMGGRWFGGRQVQASMWDGQTNFNVKVEETAEEQAARLEAFSRELEQA